MKLNVRTIFVLFSLTLVTACASTPQKSTVNPSFRNLSSDYSLIILKRLPQKVEGFTYARSTSYPESLGYSSRYLLDSNKKIYADVYSYPVPLEGISYTHKNRVKGMTRDALGEIDALKFQGKYSKADIIKKNSFNHKGRVSERIDIRLGIPNHSIELYSLLFLTEKNRSLLKIRMTMPYSSANIKDKRWQLFANKIFSYLD